MIKIAENVTDFFQWFIDLFKSIGELFTTLFSILSACIDYIKNVLSILPSWMYAVVIVLVIVCVVYKVMGREGNA